MGIEEMDPNKVGSGAVLIEPGFGVLDDFHAAALDAIPAVFILWIGVLCVCARAISFRKIVVEVEAAIEAGGEGVAVEDYGSDESGGVVAALLQERGGGDVLRRQRDAEIGDSVDAGQEAGEDRSVRSVGDRAVRESLSEANAVGREGVERGRFNLFVSVAADVVGAQSVDSDEVDVGWVFGSGGLRGGGLREGGRSEREDAGEDAENDSGKKRQPSHW